MDFWNRFEKATNFIALEEPKFNLINGVHWEITNIDYIEKDIQEKLNNKLNIEVL
jgi:hypothetical protein